MQDDPVLFRDVANLLQRLDSPNLVIGVHYSYENSIISYSFSQFVQICHAVAIHPQDTDFKPMCLQVLACVQYRVMFDIKCYDMLTFFRVFIRRSLNGEVI